MAPHKLLATGEWLVDLQSSTFHFRVAGFDLNFFFFLSPTVKMLRTTASRDDAVVGQTVPSTTVDSSKGTGTTHPASCSNVDKAGDAGK